MSDSASSIAMGKMEISDGLQRAYAYLEEHGPMSQRSFARIVIGLPDGAEVNGGRVLGILTVAEHNGFLMSEDEKGMLHAFKHVLPREEELP